MAANRGIFLRSALLYSCIISSLLCLNFTNGLSSGIIRTRRTKLQHRGLGAPYERLNVSNRDSRERRLINTDNDRHILPVNKVKSSQARIYQRRQKKEEENSPGKDDPPGKNVDDDDIAVPPDTSMASTNPPLTTLQPQQPDTTNPNDNETNQQDGQSENDGGDNTTPNGSNQDPAKNVISDTICNSISNGNYDDVASNSGISSILVKYQYELQTFFDTIKPSSITQAVQEFLVDTYIVPQCDAIQQRLRGRVLQQIQQTIFIRGIGIGSSSTLDGGCTETTPPNNYLCYKMESTNLIYYDDTNIIVNVSDIRVSVVRTIMSSFQDGTIMEYYNKSRSENPQNPTISFIQVLSAESDNINSNDLSESSQAQSTGMSGAGIFFLLVFIFCLVIVITMLVLRKYKPDTYETIMHYTKKCCTRSARAVKEGAQKSKVGVSATASTLKEKYKNYASERVLQTNREKGIIPFKDEDEDVSKHKDSKSIANSVSQKSNYSHERSVPTRTPSIRIGVATPNNMSQISHDNTIRSDHSGSHQEYESMYDDIGMELILQDMEESTNQSTDNKDKSTLFQSDVFANATFETIPSTPSPDTSMKRSKIAPSKDEDSDKENSMQEDNTNKPPSEQFPKSIRLFAESVFWSIKRNIQSEQNANNAPTETGTKRYTPDTLPLQDEAPYNSNENEVEVEVASSILEDVHVVVDDCSESQYSMGSLMPDDESYAYSQMNASRRSTVPDTIDL